MFHVKQVSSKYSSMLLTVYRLLLIVGLFTGASAFAAKLSGAISLKKMIQITGLQKEY